MNDEKKQVSIIAHGVCAGVTVAMDRNRRAWLWTFAGAVLLLSAAGWVGNYLEYGYDSTDGEERSGMKMHVDAMTGCHYLSASGGGITPRLNSSGKHICE